jgi:hypothetical protein
MRSFFYSHRKSIAAGIVILSAALIIGAAILIFLPYGIDWSMYFRPAARAMLSGESPYAVQGFYNPPWALVPLLPLALLPESLGRALLFLISFGSMFFIIRRLGARGLVGVTAFLVSLPVAFGLFNGNIDWLVMLGFLLPPRVGMLFVCLKPQVGAAVIFSGVLKPSAAEGSGRCCGSALRCASCSPRRCWYTDGGRRRSEPHSASVTAHLII